MLRIGNGYDVHRLVEGRRLILGGVEVPHTKGVLGHFTGDETGVKSYCVVLLEKGLELTIK